MGCFNYICSATNTPIKEGDKVALFVVKEVEKYTGYYSNQYRMLNDKSISLPFMGKYSDYGTLENEDVKNAHDEELIDRHSLRDYSKDSDLEGYFVMMHFDAYEALRNYKKPDLSVLWDIKDTLGRMNERQRENPENFFLHYRRNNSNEQLNNSLRLVLEVFHYWSNITPAIKLLEALESSETKTDFIKKFTPEMDFLNVIYNMGETGLNFNHPDYGRQEEEYSLIRQLKTIGLQKTSEQIMQNMEDNWFFIDVPEDEYKKNQEFTIPCGVPIYSNHMTWDCPNPISEACEEGYVRISFSSDIIESSEFKAIVSNSQEKEWTHSPKELCDVLENKVIIELNNSRVVQPIEQGWSIENSEQGNIANSYDYNKNKKSLNVSI